MTEALTEQLAAIVGASQVSTDADVLSGRSTDTPGATGAGRQCWCVPGPPTTWPRC